MTLPPLPITLDPVDSRWVRYTALAKGNKDSNIRGAPSVNAIIKDVLSAGITTKLWHIPVDALTDVEKVYTHDGQYRWYVVKLVDTMGYVREDVVSLTPLIEPPAPPPPPVAVDPTPTKPLPVEPPKTPSVAIPRDTALLMREMLGNRANSLKDDARGMLQEASRIDDILIVLDMLLKAA